MPAPLLGVLPGAHVPGDDERRQGRALRGWRGAASVSGRRLRVCGGAGAQAAGGGSCSERRRKGGAAAAIRAEPWRWALAGIPLVAKELLQGSLRGHWFCLLFIPFFNVSCVTLVSS